MLFSLHLRRFQAERRLSEADAGPFVVHAPAHIPAFCPSDILCNMIDTMAYIEYGILIAGAIVALLLFALASLNSGKKLNVLSYIIAAVLLALLTFQMSRLVGACDASSASKMVSDVVGLVSPELSEYVSSYTSEELGWFIFRRVLWSVVFTAIAGTCIALTMEKQRSRHRGMTHGAGTGRRYTAPSGRRRR